MEAELKDPARDGWRDYGDKELRGLIVVIGREPGGRVAEPVDVRIYEGRSAGASRVYCSVRCDGGRRGSGWADGGGYHKASAAMAAALPVAGVCLSQDIDGRGGHAMAAAAEAVAVALGFEVVHTVRAGGWVS